MATDGFEVDCVVWRSVNPASHLNRIGKQALDRAPDLQGDAQQLEVMTAMLMCALTVEALLNYLGHHLFVVVLGEPDLRDIYQWLDPVSKVRAIESIAGVQLLGRHPFQAMTPIFEFRDCMVHGRPGHTRSDSPEADWFDPDGYIHGTPADLLTGWEQQVSPGTAVAWRGCVDEMAKALAAAVDCFNPLRLRETTDYSRTRGRGRS
jgi:hypothetical protein